MNKLRVIWSMMIVLFSVLLIMSGCSNMLTDNIVNSPKSLEFDTPEDPAPIGDGSTPLSVPLLNKQSVEFGNVTVWIEEDVMSVCFTSTWLLAETQLDITLHPSEFPQTKKGNPIPGHFAFKTSHSPGIHIYTYEISLSEYEDVEVLYFAAHAVLEEWVDDVLAEEESAWAAGYDFPGKNWATYFAAAVPSEPIFEDGTVTVILSDFPEATGGQAMIGLMIHDADPTNMDNILAFGGFPIVGGAGSNMLSPWGMSGSPWFGTGGEAYDLYFWIDMNNNADEVPYMEEGIDLIALDFPLVFTLDGDMTLYFTGDSFPQPSGEDAGIVGTWFIDQTYECYYDTELNTMLLTQNYTIDIHPDGTYYFSGTTKWEYEDVPSTVVGNGTYTWDETAGTFSMNQTYTEVGGVVYPAMSMTYECVITDTQMILTTPVPTPYMAAEPMIYTRQ